jgi:hypothetical protein
LVQIYGRLLTTIINFLNGPKISSGLALGEQVIVSFFATLIKANVVQKT